LIGEVWRPWLSARQATGYLVIAALSCGNLLAVAREIRKRFPTAKLGILADLGNGQKDAEEVARVGGAALLLPAFGEDRPEWESDFNDMHRHRAKRRSASALRRRWPRIQPRSRKTQGAIPKTTDNVTGFFRILAEWSKAEIATPANDIRHQPDRSSTGEVRHCRLACARLIYRPRCTRSSYSPMVTRRAKQRPGTLRCAGTGKGGGAGSPGRHRGWTSTIYF
jgi:hypothetical protein